MCADSNILAVCKALATLVRCSNGDLSHNDRDVAESIITCISDKAPAAVDACSAPLEPSSISSVDEVEAMDKFVAM